jgi:tripartite-type tricarboxylate transporter receptor subunit TctC
MRKAIAKHLPVAHRLCGALLGVACFSVAAPASAAYPDHPIRMLVVSAAGGGTDITARLIADFMSRALKQQVVVQNETGGGGNVGLRMVANAPPDGYTVVVTSTGPLAANPFMYSHASFDPIKSFAPVSLMVRYYQLFVVNKDLPANNMPDLISYAKAHPDTVAAGNGGVGSTSFLAVGLLNKMAGIQLKLIPYQGTSTAIVDLVGGHINLVVSDPTAFSSNLSSGALRPLATTGLKRSRMFPNLPTVAEAVPGYQDVGWYGLLAPAGTPKVAVDLLSTTVAGALKDPKVSAYFNQQDAEIVGSTPEQFAMQIRQDLDEYRKLIGELNIHLD